MASPKLPIPKPSKWFSNNNNNTGQSFRHLLSESSGSLSRRFNPDPTSTLSPSENTSYGGKDTELKQMSPKSTQSTVINISGGEDDELRQVFNHFDRDGDGKISALELRAYFGSIGEYLSYEEAQGVIRELDRDGDGLVDFNDFLRLMKRPNDEEEDLKKAFEMFELEKGDGCITPRGLQKMLSRLGDSKSLIDCVAMIRVFDTDGNGVLDFHEFHQMMAY